MQLELLQNCGGGNVGVLRGVETFALHRGIQSYRDYVAIFLTYLEGLILNPLEIEDRTDDMEWSMTTENYLWQDWCQHHLPEDGSAPNTNVGIFEAVDGLRPGDNTYKVLSRVPLADIVATPERDDTDEDNNGRPAEGKESETDSDDPSLMERSLARSRSRSRSPTERRQQGLHDEDMENYVQLRDEATTTWKWHLGSWSRLARQGWPARLPCTCYVDSRCREGLRWRAAASQMQRNRNAHGFQARRARGMSVAASSRVHARLEEPTDSVGLVQMFATSSSGKGRRPNPGHRPWTSDPVRLRRLQGCEGRLPCSTASYSAIRQTKDAADSPPWRRASRLSFLLMPVLTVGMTPSQNWTMRTACSSMSGRDRSLPYFLHLLKLPNIKR